MSGCMFGGAFTFHISSLIIYFLLFEWTVSKIWYELYDEDDNEKRWVLW